MRLPLRPGPSRFAVLALAVIVVPAIIVAVLGFLSLRQWERTAALLFGEQAREMAAMAVDKIEMVARERAMADLGRLEAAVAEAGLDDGTLAAWLRSAPLVERLWVVDRGGGIRYPAPPTGGAGVAALLAEGPPGLWERGRPRHRLVGSTLVVTAVIEGPGGEPLLVVLQPSLDGLRREIFERTLGGLETPTIAVVTDHRGVPIYAREGVDGARLVVRVPFQDGFPRWSLALYRPPGTSPREAVSRQVTLFTGAFGLLLVVLVTGVAVTYRLVRNESEMARLKSDFVANVSHDLKTPLSVIRMFGETLEMGRLTDEARRQEYYRVITREAERLSRLIDNVLDFSRIEGGRRRYERVPTAVEPLVQETLEAFAYPLAQRKFQVEVAVAPDLPEVELDPEAVGQALGNLVDNAIKYSGDRAWLRVEAARVRSELALTVADRGLGIPGEEHERIFEKFYRVGRSDTQGRRGSGVGLALVRHVAEAHGGRVTVQSTPGEGSRFTLWLPLERPCPAS